jgi:DNA helicase-4
VIDLGRTFRCVDQIAFAARTFILRNPSQIIKEIVPKETAPRPAIRIVHVSRGENVKKLNEALASIADDQKEKQQRTSVLLLGRYHFLKPDMSDLARRFPRLSISFRTIHASKGLEADHVILLGADSGSAGFPSEMADDPLLALVSPEEEAFSNAEERRVMYVAMTRARHSLTIMASHTHPSAFVTELQEDRAYGLAAARDTGPEVEGCGECGGRLLRLSGQDGRIRYRCEHVQHCGNRLPACSSCGMALPHRRDGAAALCVCGATYPPCPDCTQGWLIERNGPYGRFLGCVRYPLCSGRASISFVE